MPKASYRNVDHNDRELLGVIDEVAGSAGATAAEIARALGITTNGDRKITPARVIGPRLGAMRTCKLLIKETRRVEEEGDLFAETIWFLSDRGKELLDGAINKSTQAALGRLKPGQQLVVLQQVAREGYVNGDETVARALKRQMQHDLAQRKLPWRKS